MSFASKILTENEVSGEVTPLRS